MSTKVISVTVYCYGVKKRCRKADRASFNVCEVPAEGFDQFAAESKALAMVRDGMKSVHPESKIVLHLLPMTIENDGLLISRTFGIGDGRKVDLTERFRGGAA